MFINMYGGHDSCLILNVDQSLCDTKRLLSEICYLVYNKPILVEKDNYGNNYNFIVNDDNMHLIKINQSSCIYCRTVENEPKRSFINEIKIKTYK